MIAFTIPKGDARQMTLTRVLQRIAALPDSRAWAIEVKEWRERKTDAQQRYLWGVVYPTIASFVGCSPPEVHDAMGLKLRFLGESHGIARIRSTGKFDVAEMGNYIDQVIAWAAVELGVIVPAPFHLEQP